MQSFYSQKENTFILGSREVSQMRYLILQSLTESSSDW